MEVLLSGKTERMAKPTKRLSRSVSREEGMRIVSAEMVNSEMEEDSSGSSSEEEEA
jgi:hypothetical protein